MPKSRSLADRSTRDLILFLVPLVSAIAGGIWTVVTYFVPGHADTAKATAAAPPAPAAAVRTAAPIAAPAPIAVSSPTPSAPPPAGVSATHGVAIGGSVANSSITVSGNALE